MTKNLALVFFTFFTYLAAGQTKTECVCKGKPEEAASAIRKIKADLDPNNPDYLFYDNYEESSHCDQLIRAVNQTVDPGIKKVIFHAWFSLTNNAGTIFYVDVLHLKASQGIFNALTERPTRNFETDPAHFYYLLIRYGYLVIVNSSKDGVSDDLAKIGLQIAF